MTGKRDAPVVVVTGASSGIGRAGAALLARTGCRVYGTCRTPPDSPVVDGLAAMLPMDLRDTASVHRLRDEVLARERRVDALVCCAGIGISGALEDLDPGEAAEQMDTNFMGTVRTIQAFLPRMRERGNGRIIVVGSLAGLTGMPFQSLYSAGKFALEGLVESLRHEVGHFGIQVCILEPGDFRTGFTDARRTAAAAATGPYRELHDRTLAIQVRDERSGSDPGVAARCILNLLARKRLPIRVTTGPPFQRFAIALGRILPGAVFERCFALYYRMPRRRISLADPPFGRSPAIGRRPSR